MNRSLLDSLRKGGFIFYARHGEATVGRDLPNINFQNCLTQRNLSEKGRRQAIYYGEILRFLRIPIKYPVAASPFCRTIETAQLAFGSGNVQVDPFWVEIYSLSDNLLCGDRQRILNGLQSVLESKPEEGRNTIIIAHSFPEGISLGQIPNLGTVIVKPRGIGSGYEVVSQLSLSDLSNLGS
ncbi:histidine phosphatase family protein [Viridibacillus sp. NPDC093762]|uniref:histidine phosphatase family protein n=1 Tax=Viridibacillus sp. NPDC093762 TaxID=3390720 RepID=UPI003D07E36E